MAGQHRYKISYLSSDGRLEETVVEATTYMNKDGLITFLKEEGQGQFPVASYQTGAVTEIRLEDEAG